MLLPVADRRSPAAAAPRANLWRPDRGRYGQDQARQTGHQGDGDHAAHQEVQGGPRRRVQAAPELIEGTAEDEGEVLLRFRENRPGVRCLLHFVFEAHDVARGCATSTIPATLPS